MEIEIMGKLTTIMKIIGALVIIIPLAVFVFGSADKALTELKKAEYNNRKYDIKNHKL